MDLAAVVGLVLQPTEQAEQIVDVIGVLRHEKAGLVAVGTQDDRNLIVVFRHGEDLAGRADRQNMAVREVGGQVDHAEADLFQDGEELSRRFAAQMLGQLADAPFSLQGAGGGGIGGRPIRHQHGVDHLPAAERMPALVQIALRHGHGDRAIAAALDDGAMEQSLGQGRGHQVQGVPSAGGFPKHRQVAGVAAEHGDVVPHPLQGADQVQGAVIAGVVRRVAAEQGGMAEPAEGTQAVVDADHHQAPRCGQGAAHHIAAAADAVAAAMNPQHHWQVPGVGRRPDVQVKAVLLPHHASGSIALCGRNERRGQLRARRAERQGFNGPDGRGRRLRRLPAQLSHRRTGEGHAQPSAGAAAVGEAHHIAGLRASEGGLIALRRRQRRRPAVDIVIAASQDGGGDDDEGDGDLVHACLLRTLGGN